MKTCSKCKQSKERSEFYNRLASKDGKSYQCKNCTRQANEEYRARRKTDQPTSAVPLLDEHDLARLRRLVGVTPGEAPAKREKKKKGWATSQVPEEIDEWFAARWKPSKRGRKK